MKLVPSTIGLHLKSNAEKKVFSLLKLLDLQESGVCFHSLRLSEHYYKRMGEIDFLVLTESGIFVLEVKGGDVRRDEDGIWTITDRSLQKHRKNESPFDQASDAMFSLLDNIGNNVEKWSKKDICFGYGVVFPDCVFDIKSVEWASETILDKRAFKSPSTFRSALHRMVSYWKYKSHGCRNLYHDEITRISTFLRPQFDLARSLAHKASEIEELMVTFTNQQIQSMDIIEPNERILCTGGAGTGKTFIAVEVAERLAEQSLGTLFICRSPVLAAFIRNKVSAVVDVIPFELADATQKKYEVVVVDEGQDVINFQDLMKLDAMLKGGLEKGRWRIFLDRNNQSGIVGAYEDTALEMLKLYHPVEVSLTRNCRNTEPIVNAVKLITASDIGVATAGKGPEVRYLYAASDGAVAILESEIDRLLHSEVALGEITLISPKDFDDSVAARLPPRFRNRLTKVNPANVAAFPFHNMSFSTVYDFKGLENRFVFMIDFTENFSSELQVAPLYVAMTRARVSLTIILSDAVETAVNLILIKNVSLIKKNKS